MNLFHLENTLALIFKHSMSLIFSTNLSAGVPIWSELNFYSGTDCIPIVWEFSGSSSSLLFSQQIKSYGPKGLFSLADLQFFSFFV